MGCGSNVNKFATCNNHDMLFIGGDTEFLRINLKDGDGLTVPVNNTFTCRMGIKTNVKNPDYAMPVKYATFFPVTEPFTIQFEYTDEETNDLLSYTGTNRVSAEFVYDVELIEPITLEVTTILSGKLGVQRSVTGAQ